MTIGRRRWNRLHPAPPPTPEGMVYAKYNGRLQLVPAAALQQACRQSIGHLDELDPVSRRVAYETGDVPEKAKARANVGLAPLGIRRL